MKKSFLFSAAALMMFGSMSAEMVWKAETVWDYSIKNGVANAVPGLDGGWSAPAAAPTNDKVTSTCSRFGVGLNGKILTTDHKKHAIIAIDKNGVTTYKELPARTTEKWEGTMVTTDDAGNVIINYCFTDAKKSAQQYAVITPDGTLTNIECASSLANQGATGRVDNMGHIVGDVTSPEGGIGYVVSQNSGQVIKLMFKGDGTKVTSLDCAKAYDYALAGLTAMKGNSALAMATSRLATVAEINAAEYPAFIVPIGVNGNAAENLPAIDEGWVGKFVPGWSPTAPAMGNRFYLGIACFHLQGKTYIVRNYLTDDFVKAHQKEETGAPYTKWKGVMNFAVYEYDAAAGTADIVATWQESEYYAAYGMGTLTAEVVDDNTVNIYTWASNGTVDGDTPAGVFCAMVKFTLEEAGETTGSGTAADPYLIATADDLCNAWKLVQANEGKEIYFEQTADIDMAGIKKYEAVNGFDGKYTSSIVYDGKGHLIKNFGPEFRAPSDATMGYYCTTVFGVLSGTVKNLGIVDCNIDGKNWGAGGVAAYGGHADANVTKTANLDNVFVTGKIASDKYAGGMFGTAGQGINISNSYAVVTVTDNKFAGGVVGRLGQPMTFAESYVMATVTGDGVKGLVAGSNAAVEITGSKSIVIGEGDIVAGGATVNQGGFNKVATLDETTLGRIQKLPAFTEKKMLNGMPTLNWLTDAQLSGVEDVIVDGIDNENAPVEYFNLQGVRVENPSNGLYIKRQGNKVTKVIVR